LYLDLAERNDTTHETCARIGLWTSDQA